MVYFLTLKKILKIFQKSFLEAEAEADRKKLNRPISPDDREADGVSPPPAKVRRSSVLDNKGPPCSNRTFDLIDCYGKSGSYQRK